MRHGPFSSIFLVSLLLLVPWAFAEAQPRSGQGQEGPHTVETSVGPRNGEVQQDLIDVNFEDVDILVFIKFVSEVTGKNFVVDPKVRGNVTVVSPTKIPLDEVHRVFLSVLEVYGYAAVQSGRITKIVPSMEARGKGEAPPFPVN